MFNKKIFSERLKKSREKKKYNGNEVAKGINITSTAYYYIESGKNRPNIATITALFQFLDVSIDYLVGATDDPKKVLTTTPAEIEQQANLHIKNLRYIIQKHDLTNEEVAKIARVDTETVFNWVTGKKDIYVDDLLKICKSLEINPYDFLEKDLQAEEKKR